MRWLADFPRRHWFRLSAISIALLPLAALFALGVAARRMAFRRGWLRSERLPVPVVVVGNIVIGGTGKTPLVLWLARELARRGRHPGIVSRGYGGATAGVAAVPADGDAERFGDEPVLLAARSGCPVWVGRDRASAARALLEAHPLCNVIILDDGLQHYRLARDFEIAVEDERGHGNGLMLPAGPLREPASRRVDALVVNGGAGDRETFGMRLAPTAIRSLDGTRSEAPRAYAGRRVHAVAGIGNPERFFATLAALGMKVVPHAFPDHHRFRLEDLAFGDDDPVLMTEKDAVKCVRFGERGWSALAVEAEIDARLADRVEEKLRGSPSA